MSGFSLAEGEKPCRRARPLSAISPLNGAASIRDPRLPLPVQSLSTSYTCLFLRLHYGPKANLFCSRRLGTRHALHYARWVVLSDAPAGRRPAFTGSRIGEEWSSGGNPTCLRAATSSNTLLGPVRFIDEVCVLRHLPLSSEKTYTHWLGWLGPYSCSSSSNSWPRAVERGRENRGSSLESLGDYTPFPKFSEWPCALSHLAESFSWSWVPRPISKGWLP